MLYYTLDNYGVVNLEHINVELDTKPISRGKFFNKFCVKIWNFDLYCKKIWLINYVKADHWITIELFVEYVWVV